MPIVFVTGTDTGCGKTHSSLALMAALRARGDSVIGYKPVAAGCERIDGALRNADALALQAASTLALDYSEVNPVALEPAVAPHIAAAEAGQLIDIAALREGAEALAQRADWVVMEGAGGWLVPLAGDQSMADLARGFPVLLVVGMKLGCLNHALLSARAVGEGACGWIANVLPPPQHRLAANLDALHARMPWPCLGVLPASRSPEEAAEELDIDALCLALDRATVATVGKAG